MSVSSPTRGTARHVPSNERISPDLPPSTSFVRTPRSMARVPGRTGRGTMVFMQATVQLPEEVLQQLEMLAEREGGTPGDLIRRIVEEHILRSHSFMAGGVNVSRPLIPASE